MCCLKLKLIQSLCLVSVWIASTSGARIKRETEQTIIEDEDRIVNGQDATIQQIPHIVQILRKYDHGNRFLCGGTLISNRYIASAAHCFKEYHAEDLSIIANATYLTNDEGAIEVDVKKLYKHPEYDPVSDDNDFALIELIKDLPICEGIQPADMCDEMWKGEEKVLVAGWGHEMHKASKVTNQLQMVELDTLSTSQCLAKYRDLTENMICTVVSKGKDACQGDSGGPAFYNGKLCGIVSFGFECGRDMHPAIFTNIAKFRNFINGITGWK